MKQLILMRHGQTDWNVARRYQGQSDIPLNAVGLEQAAKAHEALKDTQIDIAYSSDLSRAAETARISLAGKDTKIVLCKELRERFYGSYEGRSFNEPDVEEKYVKEAADDPLGFAYPGGESLLQLSERTAAFWNDFIRDKHQNETVMIVSHGTFLTILTCQLFGTPLIERMRYRYGNAEPFFIDPSEIVF